MKEKVVLMFFVLVSLLFISPYVVSFSFDEVNYDLSNVVGYFVYDFKLITGMAGIPELDEGDLPGPVCGDEAIDSGEVCDGSNLKGYDCVSQGFDSGSLGCLSDCSGFDTGGCVSGPVCGDGTCDAEETCSGCPADCDGEQADCSSGETCEVVFGSGSCIEAESSLCNNNLVEGSEICDGSDLNSETCVTQGFNSGSLGCSSNCLSFDTSSCVNGDQAIVPPSDNEEALHSPIPTTCADVSGVCSDKCINNFVHYDDSNFDRKCEISYGEELICCVPSYVMVSGDDEENQEEISDNEVSGNVKSVEDYMIDESENVQTSQTYYDLENGLDRIMLSPNYAMGGVWVVFILTVFVIGISFYVHGRIFRKK